MLKTSLIITGDASVAKREVDGLTAAVNANAAASKAATAPATQLDAAQKQVTASARSEKAAIADANAEIGVAAERARASATANAALATSHSTVAGASTRAAGATREHTKAVNDNQAALNRHAFGARNLGQQFGDMAVMIQGGIDPIRAFATQAAQMGYAMSEMGGRIGKVGAFLTGPWGITLTVAGTLLAPFVSKLFETGEAADEARDATADLTKYIDNIGSFFDQTTGKIRETNAALIQFAILSRQNKNDALRGEIVGLAQSGDTARDRSLRDLKPTFVERGLGGMLPRGKVNFDVANALALPQAQADARLREIARGNSSNAAQAASLLSDRAKFARALSEMQRNNAEIRSLQRGVLDPSLRSAGSGRKARSPKAPSTAARDEFGLDAVDRIAGITDRFSDMPPAVRQVNQATRELDDIIRNLETRKPPNFKETIATAREAKTAIQEGLNKPFNDYMAQQARSLELGALALQGRTLEAEALKAIIPIEEKRGQLSDAQRLAILGSLDGLRRQERQLERNRALQQVNLNALRDMQGIIAQSIYEGPESLADLPGRIFDSFKRTSAEFITEQLFGEMFRDMRDQVMGANKVDGAANEIVSAFGRAADSADDLTVSLAQAAGVDGPDIVVKGKREKKSAEPPETMYGKVIRTTLTSLGLGENAAKKIGEYAGKGLQGAFEGQMAAGVAGMLGIKTSSTGSAIGGAIGSFLPIPGGSIIGGLIGGLAGGLFGKPKEFGTATLSGGDAAAVGGNKGSVKAAASGAAGSVQQGLAQIAEQLGGSIGRYDVMIGQYDGKWRVRDSAAGWNGQGGLNFKGNSASGLTDFGKDGEAAAIAYAIQNAIADGGIEGISAAVAKALRSSTDIDKALKEALKVQEVELISGGIAAEYAKAFRDLETQAKERVRIATQYGFDVVAIEQRNAQDRLKLTEDLLKAQVGSLQSLVDEMTSGSLFEGTAMERLAAINDKIAKAKTDVDAGVAGAADTLAGLYQQRLEVSKDAYGTTGAYAADRNATLNEANAIIARANARIVDAQSKSDPALATTNAALDENNDQNAQMIAALNTNNALLQQWLSSGGIGAAALNLSQVRV